MTTRTVVVVTGVAAVALTALLPGFIWPPEGRIGWAILLLGLPIAVPTWIALTWKRHPLSPGAFAGLLCFFIVMAYSVVASLINGVEDTASDPSCDAFCHSKAGGWALILFFGSIWAVLMSLFAFFLAGMIAANRRPTARVL